MILSLRQYHKTAAMAAAGIIGDGPLFVADYLLRFMRVALLLSIWRTLFAGRDQVSGLPLPAVLTYTLVGEAFAQLLGGYTGLADAHWNGSISTRFLRPMNLFGQFTAEAAGAWAFNFCLFSTPLLVFALPLGVNPLPASPASAALFLVSLLLAMSVGLALDYIFGGVAIAVALPPWVAERTRRAVGGLLSGAIIPLALMPWGLGRVFAWTPFAALASAPLQIYIGRGEPVRMLALQAFWSLALWPVATAVWAMAREKMVLYGG